MNKLIAVCGINCEECEAYIATKNDDMEKRKELAEKWSKLYNTVLPPESINCVGCRVDGKHVGYCEGMCQVRKCGISKNIENCAMCNEYPGCNVLNEFLKMAPEEEASKIKSNLEKIKSSL
jgi:hypothetical protein